MIGVQDELKLLNRDKGDVMEKHAREIGDQEAQVVALRQQISELQGMVCTQHQYSPNLAHMKIAVWLKSCVTHIIGLDKRILTSMMLTYLNAFISVSRQSSGWL